MKILILENPKEHSYEHGKSFCKYIHLKGHDCEIVENSLEAHKRLKSGRLNIL
ncbi:MAG: hypothetical protein KJ721_01840 [Nanoarchaeota archaeon]|nr:hypothetical protein [Nanoarchaeota archaeon]